MKLKYILIFLLLIAIFLNSCSNVSEELQDVPSEQIQEEVQTDETPTEIIEEPGEINPSQQEEVVEPQEENIILETSSGTALNPNPPLETTKIIFIHHSTGENWLRDDYGTLGRELDKNNYFLSDTNYGWGPDGIGDRTDIINWREWFRNENTPRYMKAVFEESGQHSDYTRTQNNPGGVNEIIIIKSCFPNSAIEGNPNDLPTDEGDRFTISNYKFIYNDLLKYFESHPDKLFVIVTAPPLIDGTYSRNARAFNEWLMNDWLKENNYKLKNVVVFDFYNVLTSEDAHHRYNNGKIEHIIDSGRNTLEYPSGDDHPSEEGSKKATREFVPLLNVYVNCWKGTGGCP